MVYLSVIRGDESSTWPPQFIANKLQVADFLGPRIKRTTITLTVWALLLKALRLWSMSPFVRCGSVTLTDILIVCTREAQTYLSIMKLCSAPLLLTRNFHFTTFNLLQKNQTCSRSLAEFMINNYVSLNAFLTPFEVLTSGNKLNVKENNLIDRW